MKKTFLLLVMTILTFNVKAQPAPEKIQKDGLQIGRASTLLPKELIFDSGDGVSNKKLSLDPNDNSFSLNSSINISGAISGASSSVTGTSVHQSGITLGSGTDASKQITVDRAGFDPYLKWNETAQKWVFSQDGTNEKNFGSGSGGEGGVNLLQNPSFEDGVSVDWTSSGGTFSLQPYAEPDPSGNDSFYARFIAAGAGEYFESVAKVIPSNLVGGCLAKIKYNTTDSANWKLQVYDGSANLLKEETLYVKNWQDGFTGFPCPSSGDTVLMRVISLAAGQIEGDKAHLGSENRTFQVAQAKIAGASYFAGTASCSWSKTGSTMAAVAAVAACPGPTVTSSEMGQWLTTDTNLPIQTINNLPAGKYKATFYLSSSSSGNFNSFAINDGSSTCEAIKGPETATGEYAPSVVSCIFDYSSKGDRSFQIFVSTSSGTTVIPNGTTTGNIKFELIYYPNSSQTALVPEAQDWFIDANLWTTSTHPQLGTGSVSSYTELTSGDLVIAANTGSAGVKIPCSGTNSATGTTCSSGSESVGVNFINPSPGFYEACFKFSHDSSFSAAAGSILSTFQVVQTANNSQTILQEGKDKTFTRRTAGTSYLSGGASPHSNCGTFYFSDVGEKTLRLMYEQLATSVSASFVSIDRNASIGQQDLHIVVRPLLSAYNRPYLTGSQVTTPGSVNPKTVSFMFGGGADCNSACSSGNCTICKKNGSIVTAIERVQAGTYHVHGLDANKYVCTGTGYSSSGGTPIRSSAISSNTDPTKISIASYFGTNALDVSNASVICHGE